MRSPLLIALFIAGLLAGVIGSGYAADAGNRTLSAAGDGAWILEADGAIRHCWARSMPSGSKDIDCALAPSR